MIENIQTTVQHHIMSNNIITIQCRNTVQWERLTDDGVKSLIHHGVSVWLFQCNYAFIHDIIIITITLSSHDTVQWERQLLIDDGVKSLIHHGVSVWLFQCNYAFIHHIIIITITITLSSVLSHWYITVCRCVRMEEIVTAAHRDL